MPHYTESACTACPRNCRVGTWMSSKKPGRGCVAGAVSSFRVTEYVAKDATPTQVLAEPVTEVPAGVTMLLGCRACGTACPCLLEVTGPADVRGFCVLAIDRKPTWFRVTG